MSSTLIPESPSVTYINVLLLGNKPANSVWCCLFDYWSHEDGVASLVWSFMRRDCISCRDNETNDEGTNGSSATINCIVLLSLKLSLQLHHKIISSLWQDISSIPFISETKLLSTSSQPQQLHRDPKHISYEANSSKTTQYFIEISSVPHLNVLSTSSCQTSSSHLDILVTSSRHPQYLI
jgi:hypothetical protein